MNFGEREGKAKAKHRGRVLEKVYYYYFFFNNILLMWKIVGALKASVLYVYIDKDQINCYQNIRTKLNATSKCRDQYSIFAYLLKTSYCIYSLDQYVPSESIINLQDFIKCLKS